jgi:hypothetical protein
MLVSHEIVPSASPISSNAMLTIEEIPDPRTYQPCAFCKALPRYLAVIPEDGRKRLRGAIPLCNDCANDQSVLSLIEEAAESF